ncbi:ribonuclease P protein component [Fuchsiella alkaliacetigena]|uniref:ribonuclease P protein component n=1 Tax=Fuchsiella alkaliacetigena TaxID=957042 RepID=UPI00200B1FED|nr:ribonuclease P protein component [Fuchsiella alkaliacetigena]MCK8824528.1 ribonuclease P protein component [Fuchsiella alkaliacetigena]
MKKSNKTFPKSERLTKNHQFKRVYEQGNSIANEFVVLYFLKNGGNKRRIGFSISKKIGKAVIRNRIKRIFKEIYRKNKNDLVSGIDLIIIARKGIAGASYKEIKAAVFNLFIRASLFK